MTPALDNLTALVRARVEQVRRTPMTERSYAVSISCAFADLMTCRPADRERYAVALAAAALGMVQS